MSIKNESTPVDPTFLFTIQFRGREHDPAISQDLMRPFIQMTRRRQIKTAQNVLDPDPNRVTIVFVDRVFTRPTGSLFGGTFWGDPKMVARELTIHIVRAI